MVVARESRSRWYVSAVITDEGESVGTSWTQRSGRKRSLRRRARSVESLVRRVQRRLGGRSLALEGSCSQDMKHSATAVGLGTYKPLVSAFMERRDLLFDPAELTDRRRTLQLQQADGHQLPVASEEPPPATTAAGDGCCAALEKSSLDSGVVSDQDTIGAEATSIDPLPFIEHPPRLSKRSHKHRHQQYELCLGHVCYRIETERLTVSILSSQNNRTDIETLVNSGPLRSFAGGLKPHGAPLVRTNNYTEATCHHQTYCRDRDDASLAVSGQTRDEPRARYSPSPPRRRQLPNPPAVAVGPAEGAVRHQHQHSTYQRWQSAKDSIAMLSLRVADVPVVDPTPEISTVNDRTSVEDHHVHENTSTSAITGVERQSLVKSSETKIAGKNRALRKSSASEIISLKQGNVAVEGEYKKMKAVDCDRTDPEQLLVRQGSGASSTSSQRSTGSSQDKISSREVSPSLTAVDVRLPKLSDRSLPSTSRICNRKSSTENVPSTMNLLSPMDQAGSSVELDSTSSSSSTHRTSSAAASAQDQSLPEVSEAGEDATEDDLTLNSPPGAQLCDSDVLVTDKHDRKRSCPNLVVVSPPSQDHVVDVGLPEDAELSSPEEVVPAVPDIVQMAHPLLETSEELMEVARTLRTLLQCRNPQLVRDRKHHLKTFRRCMVGTEMVDWLMQLSASVRSRQQAASMWQALLEEGLVSHVSREHPFRDKYLFYRFRDDIDVMGSMIATSTERRQAEGRLQTAISLLQQRAPDALIRLILRKPPPQRTREDLELVYEELLHIKALSHLTNSVKRELAGVIVFESHPKAGSILFRQGEEGQSWYIVLRGSVNVVIHGKGTVTSLAEGDDFGNLALINDAPRAATIVCRQDNCHFLRVDKEDFNRILLDVEANTVRLKEHGEDVLVLEKLPESSTQSGQYKYSVMAGTPQKMLEHLLETRFSGDQSSSSDLSISDVFLDDFLLTHVVFFPFKQLAEELLNKYRPCQEDNPDKEYALVCKQRVIRFLHRWASIVREPALEDLSNTNSSYLQDLYHLVEADATTYGHRFREATHLMMDLMEMRERACQERQAFGIRKWKMPSCGHRVSLFSGNSMDEEAGDRCRPIQHHDEMIFRVYCADHTFCTLKFPLSAKASAVRRCAADKLGLSNEHLLLVELKSSGERHIINNNCTNIPTGLTLNGRLFVIPKDHLDALTPLPEQEGPKEGSNFDLEAYNSRDLAAVLTQLDWEAFNKIHEYEVLYHVLGRQQLAKTTANLDVFFSRFNQYQFWVTSEICLCQNASKRLALLKKFIKMAAACREARNLNAFFAIVMGLSNSAVLRLTQTWERLPSKLRKINAAFEVLIDPTRNHRAYRVFMAALLPPIIPFIPLIIKDMTFTHDGNYSCINGLVNFEKMHMLAQTMRTLRYCRSRPPETESDLSSKVELEIRRHMRSLYVIDNQKILNHLSYKVEGRKS